jgi:hypothetical protein
LVVRAKRGLVSLRLVRTSRRRAHGRCDRAFVRLEAAEFGKRGLSKIDAIRLRYGVNEEKAKAQKRGRSSSPRSSATQLHDLKVNPSESAPLDFSRRPRKHRLCQIHADEPRLAAHVAGRFNQDNPGASGDIKDVLVPSNVCKLNELPGEVAE